MAERSGFFESMYDAGTGEYDREYYAAEFAKYFALFIGNGVFANPVNQLKVVAANSGLKVVLKAGWAFINGYWYQNDSDKELSFMVNASTSNRIDSVKIRFNEATRLITGLYFEGDTSVIRSETFYDLKVAEISVGPSVSAVTDEDITDTRGLDDVCGFVTGLIDLTDTGDLFKQYDTIFNNWFANVENTLSGDVAGNLLNMIGTLSNLKTTNKNNLVEAVNEIYDGYLPLSGGTLSSGTENVLTLQCRTSGNYPALLFESIGMGMVGKLQFGFGGQFNIYSDIVKTNLLSIFANGDIKAKGDSLAKVKNVIDDLLSIKSNTDSNKIAGALAVKDLAGDVTKFVYSSEEPTTVAEGTIVAVYED